MRFWLASDYHVAGDACWQLSNSKYMVENGEFPLFEQFGRDEPFWPPPVFHILAAFMFKLFLVFGREFAEFGVRMISPLFGSLTLVLVYLIAKRLFNAKVAFYSLLFMAFIPLHLDYSAFSYIDGLVTFLTTLSVYLALRNRVIGASIAVGLAILTKYNGGFILPVVAYIIFMNNKGIGRFGKSLFVMIVPVILGIPWLFRNWVSLGNPVWPFLNDLFKGYQIETFSALGTGTVVASKVFDINGLISIFLGIFGVPDGNINLLLNFKVPFFNLLFIVWLIGALIFTIPLLLGFLGRFRKKFLLLIWIGVYLGLIILYVLNASWSVARFLLPAFPAMAMLWGVGISRIKSNTVRKGFLFVLMIIMVGFVFTSVVKINYASNVWDSYENDFKWVRENTDKDSTFLTSSQCLSYNIERQSRFPKIDNLNEVNYVFVNQWFRVDNRVILDEDLLDNVEERGKEVYENKKTGSVVYRIS